MDRRCLGWIVLQCLFDLQGRAHSSVHHDVGFQGFRSSWVWFPQAAQSPWALPAKIVCYQNYNVFCNYLAPWHLQLSPSIPLTEFASLGSHSPLPLQFSPSLFASRKRLPRNSFTASSLQFMEERMKLTGDKEPAEKSFEPLVSRRHTYSFRGTMLRWLYSVDRTSLL